MAHFRTRKMSSSCDIAEIFSNQKVKAIGQGVTTSRPLAGNIVRPTLEIKNKQK